MVQSILGIDVSKDSLDVELIHESGHYQQSFNNTENGINKLKNWLVSKKAGQVHVCLEATGQYSELPAEGLYAAGHLVSVVNPARIKRYGDSKLHRNKTDKADAALIAEFCLKEKPNLWAPLPPYKKELRCLVRHLDDLQRMYQQERNRLKSGERNTLVLDHLKAHMAYLQQSIKLTKAAIFQLIRTTPELKRDQELLVTIPGIGEITAARLQAEIGEIADFADASQLAAYAGLNPKGFRSGTSVHKKTRISKEGRAFLRYIIYMPAVVARYHNPLVKAFCDNLEKRRRLPQMPIIAAAMRKLFHIVFGVLKHQMPFDPNFAHLHQGAS